MKSILALFATLLILSSCQSDISTDRITQSDMSAVDRVFGDRINLDDLHNYANQAIPSYIGKDNSNGQPITDIGATLGRVLFYDKMLSVDGTISCASCHQQEHAFGDINELSIGVNGITGRHSMRLVNARFADDVRFFWDERANSLEEQTTMPIQDHAEMGYSGTNGDPSLADLIELLQGIDYYQELFTATYGDTIITEERIQIALAQFVRSIQSFDSRYDDGRSQVNNQNAPFPNFSDQENIGKQLFTAPITFMGNTGERIGGGLACQGCHRAPEFDIAPLSRNNGVVLNPITQTFDEYTVTRSPTLRDIINPTGELNGKLMHPGIFTLDDVIDHYNDINVGTNPNLDNRLSRGGGIKLNMTGDEKEALKAFLLTLSGTNIYTNEKWSDPF